MEINTQKLDRAEYEEGDYILLINHSADKLTLCRADSDLKFRDDNGNIQDADVQVLLKFK